MRCKDKRWLCKRRFWFPALPVLIAGCLTAAFAEKSAGGPSKPVTRPLRELTTAHEAHSLTPEEALRGYPVHLRAIVTYFDPYVDTRHGALFLVDASGAIFVKLPSQPILPLRKGTLVDLHGFSGMGDYAPIIERARIEVIGQSHLPPNPPRVTLLQMVSGAEDGQWVEVEGVVRSFRMVAKNVFLDLATVGGQVSASTRAETGADYGSLVDSRVRIHANVAPLYDRKHEMIGARLLFPSLEEVAVVEPAAPEPFALPILPISQILRFTPKLEFRHRVHVQGRVTLQWPGRSLCIQQAGDGLCMITSQDTAAQLGDLVDVVGFPASRDYRPTLENAVFRIAPVPVQAPSARLVTANQALDGDFDAELVEIEGDLIGQDHGSNDPTLMLRAGNSIFPATLAKSAAGSGLLPLKDGSHLRVTGICSVQVDDQGSAEGSGGLRPKSVRFLLRSLEDIEILKAPSWWTSRHALEVAGIIAAFAFAAFAWVIVLRHRVERQTQQIRDREEQLRRLSQHDALTGLPNRYLLADRMRMALARAERFESGLGLLMVDLDGFKAVNDSLGHHAGDELLCAVAQRLTAVVRKADTVARIGGDEFIVLLPDLGSALEAEAIAAGIVHAIAEPFHLGRQPAPISASVGVCTFPEGGRDPGALLKSVDAAMYRAKALGRNQYQVFAANTVEETAREHALMA